MPKNSARDTSLITKIIANTADVDALHIASLQNPDQAQAYLEVALEEFEDDHDMEAFLLALRTLAKAQGGVSALAEKSNVSRQNLYRALSGKGNPRLDTLTAILHGLGFRLSVQPLNN